MRIYYPDDDDGDALRAREMYGAVIEGDGGLAGHRCGIGTPGARTVSVFAAVEDQGTVERVALALAKRAELA